MPNILFRYIARINIISLVVVICSISFLVLVFDFIEMLRFSSRVSITMMELMQLCLMKNYSRIQKAFPFIFILSTMMTYLKLAHSSELIAMRSYGMSVWQFLAPTVVIALVFGFLHILLFSTISASLLLKYDRIEAITLKKRDSAVSISKNGLWLRELNGDNTTIIHIEKIAENTQEAFGVNFFVVDSEFHLLKQIEANSAQLVNSKYWTLRNVKVISKNLEESSQDILEYPTTMNFKQIQDSVLPPELISVFKLPGFIYSTQESGFSAIKHLAYLYKLLISPIFLIAMVVIGVMFCLSIPRFINSFRSYTMALGISFLVYLFSDIADAMSASGTISVGIASMSPTLLFLGIGLYSMLHYEDG